MLEIIFSRKGGLWEEVVKRARASFEKKQDFILITNAIYTLQSEKQLMKDLGTEGLVFVEVQSPAWFKRQIFEFEGKSELPYIDENGKKLLVELALESNIDKLKTIKFTRPTLGLTSSFSSLISELKENDISPEKMFDLAQKQENKHSKDKFLDIANIYKSYDKLCLNRFLDEQDEAFEMIKRIKDSERIKNTNFAFFGFDTISPYLSSLVISIAKYSKSCLFTMINDGPKAKDYKRFEATDKSLDLMAEIARQSGVQTIIQGLEKKNYKEPPELIHLEENLLMYSPKKFTQKTDGIEIFISPRIYDEVEHGLAEIKRLIRLGEKPENITILCCGLDKYSSLLEARASVYGINTYVAKKRSLRSFAPLRALLYAINAISYGFKNEDIEGLIETGFSSLSEDEGLSLRSYAFKFGIDGLKWLSEFKKGDNDEELLKNEVLRRKIIEPLAALKASLEKASNVKESIEALEFFIENHGIKAKIEETKLEFYKRNMFNELYLINQLQAEIDGLFNQFSLVLNDKKLPLNKLSKWIIASLDNEKISSLPPLTGCVEIGELSHMTINKPRHLFIFGLDEAAFKSSDDGILSLSELENISKELNLPLAQRKKAMPAHKLLSFWLAISQAQKKLYLSYSLLNENNEAQFPNPIINTIKDIFPLLSEKGGVLYELSDEGPLSPIQTLEILSSHIHDKSFGGKWLEAYNALKEDSRYSSIISAMEQAALNNNSERKISPSKAKKLFNTISISASSIERYASCPFRYFVEDGLKPTIPKKWGLESNEKGSFYHKIIEIFSNEIMSYDKNKLLSLNKEDIEKKIDSICENELKARKDTPFMSTKREQAKSAGLISLIKECSNVIIRGLQASSFVLSESEYAFGKAGGKKAISIPLSNGKNINLSGVIDRIDSFEKDGKRYFRIIDYKSGKKSLNASDIYRGLSLQLIIYLAAKLQEESDLIPAGAYYQWLGDIMLENDERLGAFEEEQQILSNLKLDGIALADKDILKAMDSEGISIKQTLTKDGNISKNSLVLQEEGFKKLISFAIKKTADIAENILSGNFDATPSSPNGKASPCDYCSFMSICRKNPSTQKSPAQSMSFDELISKINSPAKQI